MDGHSPQQEDELDEMEVEYIEVKILNFRLGGQRTFSLVCICFETLNSPVLQPTVHFAEEPIIRRGDEDEDEDGEDGERSDEEERPTIPAEKQRLIRKDTPHYKKHFKITKLPKPEAVAALLQGYTADSLNSQTKAAEDEEDGQSIGTPQQHPRVDELEDSRQQVNSSQVKVKERSQHG